MTPPSPIRILYLIGQLGLGGSEKQLYLLLKHIDKTRFQPHVVVFNSSPNYTLDDDLRRVGVVVHLVPDTCTRIYQRMVWLYSLLLQVRPHILHSWSIHDNAYAGVVGLLAGVPRRLGSVRDSINIPEFYRLPSIIRWLILHSVQGQLVNSNSIAGELQIAQVTNTHIYMLPNCVEPGPVPDGERLEGIPPEAQVIGMVANLRRKKNHLIFVRALARIIPKSPDVYGVIVGQPVRASDPYMFEEVEAEINRLDIQRRVHMLGFHPNPPALLTKFNIFCLPSAFEGTPNAILEAMAAGLPVVATHVGGIPDVVKQGVNGLLVEPGNERELASALWNLLQNPEIACKMGASGQHRAEQEFAPQVIVSRLEAYYTAQFHR